MACQQGCSRHPARFGPQPRSHQFSVSVEFGLLSAFYHSSGRIGLDFAALGLPRLNSAKKNASQQSADWHLMA